MTNEREEQIRIRAHEIWEREGRPEGRHDEHWQQAREEIDSEMGEDGLEAAQAAFIGGSSADSAEAVPAPGRKRKASTAESATDGAPTARPRKARATSTTPVKPDAMGGSYAKAPPAVPASGRRRKTTG